MSLAEDRGPASPGRDDPRQALRGSRPLDDDDLLSLDGSDRTRRNEASRGRCATPCAAALPALAILLVALAALAHTFKLVSFAGSVRDLEPDQEFDVLIIGAGAAGLAAAKQLREQTALKVGLRRTATSPNTCGQRGCGREGVANYRIEEGTEPCGCPILGGKRSQLCQSE